MTRIEPRVEHPDLDDCAHVEPRPAPIAGWSPGQRLADAERAVRELDDLARATVGAKSTLRSLLATESLSSEQILALATGGTVIPAPGADRLALRFEQACHDGRRAPAVDRALLLRTHRRLLPGGGTLRSGPVWVGGRTPAAAVYVAPPAGEVDELLGDLTAFLTRTDLCPVVQAVTGYAQLEFIHPFRDGNGRLGRWLVQVVLRRRGVARIIVPPLGLYLAADPDGFLPAHRAFRGGDREAWCTYAGAALEAVAGSARALIAAW
jgi:Fic family protein